MKMIKYHNQPSKFKMKEIYKRPRNTRLVNQMNSSPKQVGIQQP